MVIFYYMTCIIYNVYINAGMAQSFDEKDVVRCKNGYEITMMTNYIGKTDFNASTFVVVYACFV